jgi:hypothetical protein
MDGTGDHHVKQNKPESERQRFHFLSHVKSRTKNQGHKCKRRIVWVGGTHYEGGK